MLQDFKAFVMRGNVVDLAVGVVIGGAFGKVVSSFVGDVLMPPLGLLMGGVNFSDLFINLSGGEFASLAAAKDAGAATLNYGVFVNTVIDFLIIAFAIFMVVRALASMQRKPEAGPPTTKKCGECLSEIPIAARRCAFCSASLAA